jgi:uncharacterized protein (TIGR02246 family)
MSQAAASEDERAIREVMASWMAASSAGDVPKVLSLMADDAVFLVPGREPFGKQEFADSSRAMRDVQLEGTNEIVELARSSGTGRSVSAASL